MTEGTTGAAALRNLADVAQVMRQKAAQWTEERDGELKKRVL
ncbi:MAG: hypothetical protein WA324_24075 [Bryobacteraceae bacterium]